MAWYRAGTVSVTNNSTAVIGLGTAWVTAAAVGETFLGPDEKSYEIIAINSATSMTIAPAYKGATASGQNYALMPTQGYLRDLAAEAAALVESYSTVKNNAGTGKFTAGTSANPSLRNVADENTGLNFKGSDQLALVTAGAERLLLNSEGVPSGTAAVHMMNRVNHTGVQAISTVDGLQQSLEAKLSSSGGTISGPLRVNQSIDIGRSSSISDAALRALSFYDSADVLFASVRGFADIKQLRFTSAVGGVQVASDTALRLPNAYITTTASAANLFIAGDGLLQRSTSSAKYKTQVEPAQAEIMQRIIDEAEPIWYRSLCDADPEDFSYWGLIAENLGEIDPRFVHWARPLKTVERQEQIEEQVDTGEVDEHGLPIYRAETRTEIITEQVPDLEAPLQAEGVMYERLVVPLLWHAKQMQARLTAVEQRLAVLEGAA